MSDVLDHAVAPSIPVPVGEPAIQVLGNGTAKPWHSRTLTRSLLATGVIAGAVGGYVGFHEEGSDALPVSAVAPKPPSIPVLVDGETLGQATGAVTPSILGDIADVATVVAAATSLVMLVTGVTGSSSSAAAAADK